MTNFLISQYPAAPHQAHFRREGAVVDGHPVLLQKRPGGFFIATVGGRQFRLHAVAHGDAAFVQLDGRALKVERLDPTRSHAAAGSAAGAARAPMPGVVISIHAELGQTVREGDPLLVIESMKLQMTIGAPGAGTVAELPLSVAQVFQRGAVLARIAMQGESP